MGLRSYFYHKVEALHDALMFKLASSNIVYNVAWEDPRIDRHLLEIKPTDRLLMLTTGGCNVLDMLIEGPEKIVTADLNPAQNSLLALKLVCIKTLSFEDFFRLFAKGDEALFKKLYNERLRAKLPKYAQDFWDKNGSFFKQPLWSGLSGFVARNFVRFAKICGCGKFMKDVLHCRNLEEQRILLVENLGPLNRFTTIIHFFSRLIAPVIAVPASQLKLFSGNIAKKALYSALFRTNIRKDNYFMHGYLYGEYTKECCPRYLKEEYFNILKTRVNRVEIHNCLLKDAAASKEDGYFSIMILLDHMDWMNNAMILDEWNVFAEKASKDCRILWRSFATEQHIPPLKHLEFQVDKVERIEDMYADRIAMYNSTHLGRIPENIRIVERQNNMPKVTIADDLNVMYHNFFAGIKGTTHQEKLESFYKGQAKSYDSFRHRFLHGRAPMMDAIPIVNDMTWVDLGGGTAFNLEYFRESLTKVFKQVYIVDLCRPLINIAKNRVAANKWEKTVNLVVGDATDPKLKGLPEENSVDIVTMSYSLTMIPDWKAALDNAMRMLKPGGHIAICDFTVTRKHSLFTRMLWPNIFKHDNVMLNPEHIETLEQMFDTVHLNVGKGGFPYVPVFEAPFYTFVGKKPMSKVLTN